MKKLLLLSGFIVILFSGIAQNPLSLSWEGEPIGDTLLVFGSQFDFDIIAHAIVTNDSDHDMNIKVRRERLEMQQDSYSQFCWGLCYSPDTEVSPHFLLIPSGGSSGDNDFSGHYIPVGAWGSAYIKYEFFNMDNEEENVEMVVHFSATITGMEDHQESIISMYPNPASNQLTIESSDQIEKLMVFDLTGKSVYSAFIDQQKVQLNIDFLEKGIYLVRLQTTNGVRTEKLYVL